MSEAVETTLEAAAKNNLAAAQSAATAAKLLAELPEVAEHVNRTDNPHQVTAAQVSAYTKDEVDQKIAQSLGNIQAALAAI